MASNTQTLSKILRNLRDSGKTILQCAALTYIRSNAEMLEATSAPSKEEYAEICKLVMGIFTNGEQNAKNEAAKALPVILKYFRKNSLKFFESALCVDRDKRPKIFQFLETMDDNTLAVVIDDQSTIDFIKDSLSSVQTSSMEWLSPTSCTENLTLLQEAENKALSDAEELEERVVNGALSLLRRIYRISMTVSSNQSSQMFDVILMDNVVTLAYLGHRRQREPAINLLNQAIRADLPARVKTQNSDIYQRYKKNIQGHYSTRMMLLVKACDADWSSLWSISIRMLGTDLHHGAPLINKLLGVEERAFKSTDTMVRREAFVSWKLLIDNLAIDIKELATQRRVRLLCVPLTANNSKSELIAIKKLEVWWYLIMKLYPCILPFADPVITQFLNFCFGPLGDTPLLSRKYDVIASPGKRFFKSKINAIDALLQLIVVDQNDRKIMPPILDERLPSSVSEMIFAQCYKVFLHSVGEAVVIIGKFNSSEMKNREEICKVIWVNLMRYIRTTIIEPKARVYNELILVISELQVCSLEIDFVDNFLRDVIVPELSAVSNDLIYHDNTLVDFMTKIMVPKFLKNLRGKQCDAVKCLMWQTIRPEKSTNYHPETLRFLEMTLQQLRSIPLENDSLTDCFDLWFVYAEIAYKLMKTLQDVNEGTKMETNFKTIESIISFPFTNMHWANSIQAQKIAIQWKDVYKKYECQADTITSVKPNEIFDNTTKMMEACILKNDKCYRIAVYCLDALMSTINYKFLLAEKNVPTIVRVISDLTTIALHQGQPAEAECALKALSSLLITVYGHSPEKVLSYMNFTRQTIELMLKTDADDALVKEIISTWETIMSILRGLSSTLDENFLQSYKQVLSLSLRHTRTEITSQTLGMLELRDNVKDGARAILEELFQPYKKSLGKDSTRTRIERIDKTPKSPRITGSFLNRKIQSPRALSIREKQENERKKKTPLIPDPDSQDYVVIRSEVHLDVDRLTEHQKESLKRRRDDIPALYNDLSQSSSQDTQDLQKWFVDTKKNNDTNATPKASNNEETSSRIDENITKDQEIVKVVEVSAENKIIEASTIDDKNTPNSIEARDKIAEIIGTPVIIASSGQDPASESALPDESSRINQVEKSFDDNERQLPVEKISGEFSSPATNENSVKETKSPNADLSLNDETSIVVKKLNFESPEENPDGKDKEANEASSDTTLSNKTSRNRRSCKTSETNLTPAAATRGTLKNREKSRETDGEKINPASSDATTKTIEKPRETAIQTRGNTSRVTLVANKMERGTKRKAASDGENDEKKERDKRRKQSLKSPSRTVEDNDTSQSSQSNKRAVIEMSRLRIDMVSDGPLTSRRRSKYSDDYSETHGKKGNFTERKALRGARSRGACNLRSARTPDTEDNAKKNRKRVSTIDDNEKTEMKKRENDDNQNVKTRRLRGRPRKNLQENGVSSESQVIIDDDETANESCSSYRDSDKSNDSTKSNIENSEATANDVVPSDVSASPVGTPETPVEFDPDDVVESSQDSAVLTGCHKRTFGKMLKLKNPKDSDTPIELPVDSSIENKQPRASSPLIPLDSDVIAEKNDDEKLPDESQDETFLDISAIRPQLADDVPNEDTEKKAPEASKTTASPIAVRAPEGNFNFSSPKGHAKRFIKPKSFASQGRAAHMLGLVTKLANLEKDAQLDRNHPDDEAPTNKRSKTTKDNDNEIVVAKRDRANIVKEPERIGSPSGSRQEKIFNNMKSADYAASPPGKLFGNLRNNGEKISPKIDKLQVACGDNGNSNADDCNVTFANEKDELPILEWSSANPPSLTASPSASILKRNRSIVNESDTELTTPNKIPRKRVSFADPPVSKEMGYEIENLGSPHKIAKFASSRPLFARKDSPIRIKQSRFLMIQMDIDKRDVDIGCEKENELSMKIIDDIGIAGYLEKSDKIDPPDFNEMKATADDAISNETMEIEASKVINEDVSQDLMKIIGKSSENVRPVAIEDAPTQDDLFNSSDEKIDSPKRNVDNREDAVKEQFDISEQSSAVDSFRLNVTDDSVIGSITNLRREEINAQESLEDTIDVRNIASPDVTCNSVETFDENPIETSTEKANPMNEMDTLPITDSLLSTLPMTQESEEPSQNTAEIPRPELLNSTDAIYPNLDECARPIEDIVDDLTNPLWRKNLSKHLETRCIRTVGDLARLSEREIVRIPVKGSSKVRFVQDVLRKYERKLRECSYGKRANDDNVETERFASGNENQTMEVTNDRENDESPGDRRKTLQVISTLTSVAKCSEESMSLDVSGLESLASDDFTSVEDLNPHIRVPLGRESTSNQISTIIIDSSADPEVSDINEDTRSVSRVSTINLSSDTIKTSTRAVGTSTNPPAERSDKSVETQANLDELLDDIDADLLLRSAIKRTSIEKLLTECKRKMEYTSEMELCKETLRILGISNETLLKLACHECGIKKVLCELPNIFYNDNEPNR